MPQQRAPRNQSSLTAGIVVRMLLVILCASAAPAAGAGAEIVLKGERWNVIVDPETQAVHGEPADAARVEISAPRATAARARVDDLVAGARQARWTLPDENVAVSMSLEDDVLVVDFRASAAGSFTWPTVNSSDAVRAYILPMFEGLYVPADDAPWAKFLLKEGPLNTTAGLSMPFWGVDLGGRTVTYILTNPFNNELEFQQVGGRLGLKLTHTFTRNHAVKEFGMRIHLGGASPVAPAKIYREQLIQQRQFVTLKEKIEKTSGAAKLLGAPHVYLWGDGLIAREDIVDYKRFAGRLAAQDKSQAPSPARRVWTLMDEPLRKLVTELPTKEWVDNFDKGQLVEGLSGILKRRDFYDPAAWKGIAFSKESWALARRDRSALSDGEVARLNQLLLFASFSDLLRAVDGWGDGYSMKMIEGFVDAGIDRLWLGSPGWDGLRYHPEMVRRAVDAGYLIGPYDSFHSIHSPDAAETWETAQFDQELYESGAIVSEDGTKRKGFKQKGFLLSPAAARAHVERRVAGLMDAFRCNSWFIDCDAFGDVFDDYAPAHPATQEQDMKERLSRMGWIRDSFDAVIGSEGGSAYAAPVIHFAHGMMTPVIGWGDADLKDRESKYFVGGYYPPDEPAIFFKQALLKEEHRRVYADPQFRLPLYEIVFHDSVVATHQWGAGSLKYQDDAHARVLLELLYNVPPLYHLNLEEWRKRARQIKRHYDFFSPLHRQAGLMAMTDFAWLSDDRQIQRTRFGDQIELVANFSEKPFAYEGSDIPAKAILARWNATGKTMLYPAEPPPSGG